MHLGCNNLCIKSVISVTEARVGISGTTAKSRQRKFVPSSHPGPLAIVATSRKSQTKVGTLACFDLGLKVTGVFEVMIWSRAGVSVLVCTKLAKHLHTFFVLT